jgi:hypothetical protein
MHGSRIKVYRIECDGYPPTYHRLSSKKAFKVLRELHKAGLKAMMHVVRNKAEQRQALELLSA